MAGRARPLLELPTAWQGDGSRLDWKTIVQISRPGWWLVHVWLYLAPTGQKYHLLGTWRFWLGLIYALFPLNLLVYGLNDYTDVELDAQNTRKGNFMYGAKCTKEQMRDVPRIIALTNVVSIAALALVTGKWLELAGWLLFCGSTNAAYNLEPLRLSSKGPFELPLVVCGFGGVSVFASIINDIPWATTGYWWHMACLVLRTQLWTEFLDYDPDSACNRRTTSTLVGKFWSKVLVVTFLALEAAVTWYYFADTLMRLFSFSGIIAFVMLEVVRGTNDKEKKKAMKAQNALGMSLVFWIWHRGIFASS
jgi:4-hydroxybenzoate polyprenyltransferase